MLAGRTILQRSLDAFVMSVGTGGCFSGNAEVLKERLPGVRCVAVVPAAAPARARRGPLGGHRIAGSGAGFVPSLKPHTRVGDSSPWSFCSISTNAIS